MRYRPGTESKRRLWVLNEPYFASLGSSVVPLDRGTVRAGWLDIASLVKGGLGVHCCSNTDWGFVISLDPSVISLDVYTTVNEFLLYAEEIKAYMERGGVVAAGIVPAEYTLYNVLKTNRPCRNHSYTQDLCFFCYRTHYEIVKELRGNSKTSTENSDEILKSSKAFVIHLVHRKFTRKRMKLSSFQ